MNQDHLQEILDTLFKRKRSEIENYLQLKEESKKNAKSGTQSMENVSVPRKRISRRNADTSTNVLSFTNNDVTEQDGR